MSKKERRRPKRDRQDKPTATPPEPQQGDRPSAGKGGGAFYIGGGAPPIHLEAWSNDARGGITGDGRPVQISGSFDHAPVAGGSSTYVRYMHMGTGKYARPTSSPEATAPTRSFIAGFPPGVPGRRCACGFEAFAWQRTCPKCERPLQADC
jgi:hypothetical protein